MWPEVLDEVRAFRHTPNERGQALYSRPAGELRGTGVGAS